MVILFIIKIYYKLGSLLMSGSKDTNIIIWDIVSESGLFK